AEEGHASPRRQSPRRLWSFWHWLGSRRNGGPLGRVHGPYGQGDREGRPDAGVRDHLDRTFVGFDDLLREDQPEPEALEARLRRDERLEKPDPRLRVHPAARVDDRDRDLIALPAKPDRDGPEGRRLEGILQEVDEGLLQAERVDRGDDRIPRDLLDELDVRLFQFDDLLDRGGDDAPHVDRDALQLVGTTQREQFGHDHPRQSPLAIEFLQLLEDDRILHAAGDVRRQEGDVRERRVDLVGDECGDLPDRGPTLALDQATLVFLLRRHVTRDDLHVGVRALLPDDAGPDLEETTRAVLEFQVRFERLRDRRSEEHTSEVETATLEFSRGQEFPEIDPPE